MPVIKVNDEPELKSEKQVEEEVVDEIEESPEVPEVSADEEVARKKGWVPKADFKGNKDEWIDAKEFNARGPLYEAISQANKKIKRLAETVESFQEHYSKVEQTAKEKAIAELRAQLKLASDDRDIERALEVKDKITELTNEVRTENKDNRATDVTPEFNRWVADNEWYNSDRVLRHAANGIGHELQQEHPDWAPAKIYKEVEKQIRDEFPHKFNSEEESPVTTVTTTSKRTASVRQSKSKLPSVKQLPEEAKKNYRRLVKSDRNPNGPLTHEQFMKDYTAAGGPLQEE